MLYDYKCGKCEYFMEDVYQSMSDKPLVKCPQCGKKSLERVLYGGQYSYVKGGSPQSLHQLAERRYEEGNDTLPDGRKITKVEWNKTDMVEAQERRIHEKKERKQEAAKKEAQRKKINSMTKEQKINYIKNGD